MGRLAPAALLLSLLLSASAARAAEVSPELAAKAASAGTARVIVRLSVPFVPEPALGSDAEAVGQRQRIASAQSAVTSHLRGVRHRVLHQYDGLPLMAIEASPDALRMLGALHGVVASVHEDRMHRPALAQSVPLIEADKAWSFGYDGTGTIVVILDTGVDSAHEFFATPSGSKVIAEACFSTTMFDPGSGLLFTSACPGGLSTMAGPRSAAPCVSDGCYHGTHVAGIAAGGVTGATGTIPAPGAGVAPGAKIWAIQIFTDNAMIGPVSFDSDEIAALNYVYNHRNDFPGLTVASINMSLGDGEPYADPSACDDDPLRPAIAQLRSAGIATVIAAGNEGHGNAMSSPGCIREAISVGSTTKSDMISGFSNIDRFTSLLAPGSAIVSSVPDSIGGVPIIDFLPITSSVPGDEFGVLSGTSMATPHVTGTFAILRQASAGANVSTLLTALQTTGKPITDTRVQNGSVHATISRVRVFEALQQFAAPDLVVQTFTAPASALPGATVKVTASVRNAGAAGAPASALRVYLSTDNQITTSDTPLTAADVAVPALASGATSPTLTLTVTIPGNTTPGPYFIGALVNPDNTVAETNTANDAKALAFKVVDPDLLVTALSAPLMGQTGRPLAIASTVRNGGTAPAGPFRVSFFMSPGDNTPGAGTPVGFRDVGGLAANANSSATTTVTLPANMSAGTYFLSAVVDSNGTVSESNESNNGFTAAGQVTVTLYRPDFIVTSLTSPASAQTSRPLAIMSTVRNQGAAPAGAFRVNFYLAQGNSAPGAGTLIGVRSVGGLAGLTNSSATTTLTVPANLSAGSYFLSAVVDPQANVELDSTNNGLTAANPVTVTLYRSDLIVTGLSSPASALTSRPLVVTSIVRNQGTAPASTFRLNFYLSSSDSTPGAGALVGFRTMNSLAASTNWSATTTLTVPANLSAGAYFLSAVVDPQANVELDATNNGLTAPSQVAVALYRPDLILTSLSSPSAGQTGRPLAITSTVRNQGTAPASAFRLNFYLSPGDSTPGAGTLIGFRVMNNLAASANWSVTTTLTVPANLSAGTYVLSAVVDPQANVELDATNDGLTAAGQVTITPFRPDLTMTLLTAPPTGAIGHTISVANTVSNIGPAPSGSFKVSFFLSTSDNTPGAGTRLTSRMVGSLGAGASSPATTVLTIPLGLTAGSYFLSAVADGENLVVELDDTNNGRTASSQIVVQ